MQICRAPKCAAENALISISFISSTVRQLNMRTPIFLSRLPIHSDKANKEVDEVRLINLLQIESLPMNVDQVRKATRMMVVWPDKQITLYFSERHEIQSEMIVYCREFEFRERVLYELHQSKVSTDLSRETQTGAYA